MKSALILPFVGLIAACSSSSDEFIGGSNGLPFAASGDTATDVEGQTMTVRLARFLTDKPSNTTSLTLNDETVTFEVNGIRSRDLTVTLDGETFEVVSSSLPVGNDQEINFYPVSASADVFSALYSFRTYGDDIGQEGGDVGIDTEGFFVFGFETNPETVAATTGNVTYSGTFENAVIHLDADDGVIEVDLPDQGTIVLTSSFDDQTISGVLNGYLVSERTDFTGTFDDVAITDGGFSSEYVTTCAICVVGSGGQIEGTFFGDAAQELSGVATIDIEITDGNSYVGAGGYVATVNPE